MNDNPLLEDARQQVRVQQAKLQRVAHAGILPKFEMRNLWAPVPEQRGIMDPNGWLRSPDEEDQLNAWRYSTQLDLKIEQPLFTFGRQAGLELAASHEVGARENRVVRQEHEILFQVRQLYWGLALGRELLAVIEDVRKEHAKAESQLQQKLDEGSEEVSQTDLFKLQLFKYEVNKRQREALEKLELARRTLEAATGVVDGEVLGIPDDQLLSVNVQLDDLAVYERTALQRRPEFAEQDAKLAASQARTAAESSARYPQLFAGANTKMNFAKDRYKPNNPFFRHTTNYFRPAPVLGFRQNLNFVAMRDKIKLARLREDMASGRIVALRNKVMLEVRKTHAGVLRARAKTRESRRALKASENWLRSASMTYDLGDGEVKGLIDAFKANAAMQAEHLQNIFEFNTGLAKLSRVVGQDLYPR